MESTGDAFDAFFQGMGGGSFGTEDPAPVLKNTWPPRAPEVKSRSQGTSQSELKDTLHSRKRKFGFVSSFPDDLHQDELDLVVNEKVSHLARCFYYFTESITPDAAAETDRLDLSELYGRTLKATQEAAFVLSHCLWDLDSLTTT